MVWAVLGVIERQESQGNIMVWKTFDEKKKQPKPFYFLESPDF